MNLVEYLKLIQLQKHHESLNWDSFLTGLQMSAVEKSTSRFLALNPPWSECSSGNIYPSCQALLYLLQLLVGCVLFHWVHLFAKPSKAAGRLQDCSYIMNSRMELFWSMCGGKEGIFVWLTIDKYTLHTVNISINYYFFWSSFFFEGKNVKVLQCYSLWDSGNSREQLWLSSRWLA